MRAWYRARQQHSSPPVVTGSRRRAVFVVLVVVLSGALTAAFRFLTISFNNDHFVHLTAAQQMLFGDWPTRDYIDIGRPLQIAGSAAAQYLLGHTLFSEAVLVSAALGVAAAITATVVFTFTGSLSVAVAAALVETVAFPRAYSYPKPLMTAAALWLIAHFLRRPSGMRQIMMAAGTTIAFLFRHDLGLFVGAGGMVASMLAAPTAQWRERCRNATAFGAFVLAFTAPYLIYVHLNGGLWNYFATALEQNQTESGYEWPNPLSGGEDWTAQLLYAFHLLPVVALGVCAVDWTRSRHRWQMAFLISAAVVAVAENFGLIREDLNVRIPDAIVPAVVLGAGIARRAWQARSPYTWIPVTAVLVVVGLAVGELGNTRERLRRAGLTGQVVWQPKSVPVLFAQRSAELHERFADLPSRAARALHPFFLYVDRCTTQQHRLFLGGLIPEVAYFAQRPFAGGGYEHYNFTSRLNQQRVVDRLRRQVVPFALIPGDSATQLDDDLPIVAGYVHKRYVLLANLPVPGDESIRILVDRTLPPKSRDLETGWPCFR